jgi:hypothetical protein
LNNKGIKTIKETNMETFIQCILLVIAMIGVAVVWVLGGRALKELLWDVLEFIIKVIEFCINKLLGKE